MGLNYFLYRFKYRYAQFLPVSVPVDLSLELSSHCNQACGYCYHADQKKLPFKKGFMTFELACKLIEEASELGVHSLKFNYRGESTLHPDFERITYLAKQRAKGGTFIDRITNSNFKFDTNNDSIFRGLCNQTKVKISFDSFEAKVMEKQRKGSIHDLALKNIDKFYNFKGRNNKMVIQAVRTQLNKNEDIAAEVKRRWPDATCNINDMVTGRVDKDLSKLQTTTQSLHRKSCLQAHARLIINWDGHVTVCCPDIGSKLIVGNANKLSIDEIWNGYKALKIRQDLNSGKAFKNEPCKSCPSFESYVGFYPKWDS